MLVHVELHSKMLGTGEQSILRNEEKSIRPSKFMSGFSASIRFLKPCEFEMSTFRTSKSLVIPCALALIGT